MSSATSIIQVSGLAKEKVRALRAQARASGMTAERYARRLIEEGLSLDQEARTTTFGELYAPVRAQFRESGMTELELDELVDAARARHQRSTSRKRT